jgi:hypothetical protein
MAFVVLRRSRNTFSYHLVESYRDEKGRTRKRTLCYLGRKPDGTDTLAKAIAHWKKRREEENRQLRGARGERRQVIRRRLEAIEARLAMIAEYLKKEEAANADRKSRELRAEEVLHWKAFERLRREPSEENARAAKRAFLVLAKRHHPDHGGRHEEFIKLKATYDRALAAWRPLAAAG